MLRVTREHIGCDRVTAHVGAALPTSHTVLTDMGGGGLLIRGFGFESLAAPPQTPRRAGRLRLLLGLVGVEHTVQKRD